MAPNAPDTIYTKTAKGILEIRNKTVKLSRELGLVFLSVDGKASVGDLLPRSGMNAVQLQHALSTLVTDGYIKVVSQPGQRAAEPANEGNLDFTSREVMATVNMEAASRALAAADATKRAQAEARAALDARMRQESEARGRAQAEARAEAEAQERVKAEELARTATDERAKAEIEAREASDPAVRADAEARGRAAAAAAVRAQAEARVRAEAEERARALAEAKRAAEDEARVEAEARAKAEQQAHARAAAEAHAREILDAQVEAMRGAQAHADNPDAAEAEAARARVRELEAEAEAAREAARVRAEEEGRVDEVPQPEMDIAERLRQINVRVQAARGSRETSVRPPPGMETVEVAAKPVEQQAPSDTWPSLELGERTPSAQPPQDAMPLFEIPRDTDPAPAASVAPAEDTASTDLPVVDLAHAERAQQDRELVHPSPEHVPTALERAMAQLAARRQTGTQRAPEPVPEPAPEPVRAAEPAPELTLAPEHVQAPEPPAIAPEPREAQAPAAPAGKAEPTIDDEPLPERLNIDRAAHDMIAEAAEARRKGEAAQFNRDAIEARRKRAEDDANRAAFAARQQRRKKALWISVAALVIVPSAGIAWLQFASLNGYIPAAQSALSQRLNQPVTISTLRYVLLPTPRVVLEGVSIGDGPGIRAERVDARVMPFAALAGPRHFNTVDVHGATVDAAMLGTIPAWTGGRTAGAVHVDRLRLTEAKLNMPGTDLGTFDGNVEFESNGTLKQAVFTGPKTKIELTPRPEGVRFAVDVSGSQIPYGPPIEFSQFIVSGLVDPGQVAAAEFTGKVAGGSIEGAVTARWSGPVSVQGEFKLQNLRVQDLAGELSPNFSAKGYVKGTGRFSMQAPEWSRLRANPQIEANFSASRGELTNIDVMRAIQAPSIGAIRGGRTPFDDFSGVFQFSGGHYLYRQLHLTSGALNANGTIDVAPNGQLSGRLQAEVSSRGGVVGRSALVISGTVADPQLKR